MKKKILIILTFLIVISLKEVNANEFASYFPGGKNYLDADNFIIGDNHFVTEDNMVVKASTVYTLSIPGFDWIGEDTYIEVSGKETYLLGNPNEIAECDVDPTSTICTFTTSETEESLFFEISASMLSMFYDYYEMEGFQLEEGSVGTHYEEYIHPLIDTTNPEFSGSGAYIKSYQSNESIATIINEHITVIDDIDGDITNRIVIVSDEYTTHEQIVGEYDVHLSVTDDANNEAFFNLTIMVKDEIPPVITGPNKVTVSISDLPSIQTIMDDNFVIYDEYDNNLNGYTIIDEYSPNNSILGEYSITYEVVDDSLNTANASFDIEVVDVTIPIMIGNNIHNSYLSNPLSVTEILNSLSFSDNYSDLTDVTPTIISDEFSSNELIPGTYYINIEIMDSSNNTLSELLTINVIDDVPALIFGPVDYNGSYNQNLLLSDFKDMLSVSDNVDALSNNDIYIISDTYSSRTSKIGDYTIVFGVKDSNNNESTHQIDITLFDGVAPVIYVDNYIITVNLNSTFNENDALKLLLNSNELNNGNYTIVRLIDEYTGNEKNPGSYIYRLSFTNDEGETYEKEFLVKVEETNIISINKDLLVRNIAVYSFVLGYVTFVLIKIKKINTI